MYQTSSLLLANPLVSPKTASPRRIMASRLRKPLIAASCNATDVVASSGSYIVLPLLSSVRPSPVMPSLRYIGIRPDPVIGLLSILVVISMAIGSIFTLAIISLPSMSAFRRLAVSIEKLSKAASEEVPGTLSSLKLSGLELNDLTWQLSNLMQRISGNQYGNDRLNKPRSRERNNSIIN